MKIEYRNGDLMDTPIKTIVHGCNSHGVMGGGVAALIRKQYPDAYKEYVAEYEKHGLILGGIYPVNTKDKIIINAITQKDYGGGGVRYVSYDAIAETMEKIDKLASMYDLGEKLAMPQIGAGLANGNWNIIENIIEETLVKIKPVVYIYGA